jgi:prophage antirepressor-like protein
LNSLARESGKWTPSGKGSKPITTLCGKGTKLISTPGGEPWWVAKDVCEVLEHSNSRVAIESLEDDEKGVSKVYTPGGNQDMTVVSESGLYTLIMR